MEWQVSSRSGRKKSILSLRGCFEAFVDDFLSVTPEKLILVSGVPRDLSKVPDLSEIPDLSIERSRVADLSNVLDLSRAALSKLSYFERHFFDELWSNESLD